jgi:hypothetical protein
MAQNVGHIDKAAWYAYMRGLVISQHPIGPGVTRVAISHPDDPKHRRYSADGHAASLIPVMLRIVRSDFTL